MKGKRLKMPANINRAVYTAVVVLRFRVNEANVFPTNSAPTVLSQCGPPNLGKDVQSRESWGGWNISTIIFFENVQLSRAFLVVN